MSLRVVIYIGELYFLICQLFHVGKDATSYLLKDARLGPFTLTRINRWHRDGLIMALLSFLPVAIAAYIKGKWIGLLYITAGAFFIRMSFYNILFNHWANLSPGYFGTTPKTDKLLIKIFGVNGAVKMAIVFMALLITLQFFISG